MNILVKIINAGGHTPGKLADAELQFIGGELDGLKLVGFSIWGGRNGQGRRVSFPARQYSAGGERRTFALLRPVTDNGADARARSRAGSLREVRSVAVQTRVTPRIFVWPPFR